MVQASTQVPYLLPFDMSKCFYWKIIQEKYWASRTWSTLTPLSGITILQDVDKLNRHFYFYFFFFFAAIEPQSANLPFVSSQNTIMTAGEQYSRPLEWESSETVASRPLWNFGQPALPGDLTPTPLYIGEYFPLLPRGNKAMFSSLPSNFLEFDLQCAQCCCRTNFFSIHPPPSKLA